MTPARPDRGERLLLAALLLLSAAVWIEPAGSSLAEPDEARYAEIPREMLGRSDFVTPRLNGVPYFEKPPLLYWANAASFALFGENPWAARLPTRLAGLGTALLVALAVARWRSRREGFLAALFFLASPLPFTFSRLNLTDGVLTFFFTATLLSGFATMRRSEAGRATAGLSALTGAMAALAFLAKGLIAIVLPGGILLLWALATKKGRHLRPLLLGLAPFAFLALAVPWLWAAERAHPGFLQFFFIHEHFQRFATPASGRPGPPYYFLLVFVAGFLPGLPFFFSGARVAGRRDPAAFFCLLWFLCVLVFFSVSRSKLSPYLFPAFPAAAALAARGFELRKDSATPWRAHAAIVFLLVSAGLLLPVMRAAVSSNGLEALSAAGAASLSAGAVAALLLRRRPVAAAGAMGLGWAGLYVVLAICWPRTTLAKDIPSLARTAKAAAAEYQAPIVCYRTYVQGFPWELRSTLPVVDYRGELEDWFLPEPERRETFWPRERFWAQWRERPVVALLRAHDRGDFNATEPPARLLSCRGKYCVVANFARDGSP